MSHQQPTYRKCQKNEVTEEEDPSFPGNSQRPIYLLAREERRGVSLKTFHKRFLEDEIVPAGGIDSFGQFLVLIPLSAIEDPDVVVVRSVHPIIDFFHEALPYRIRAHQIGPRGFVVHEVPEYRVVPPRRSAATARCLDLDLVQQKLGSFV